MMNRWVYMFAGIMFFVGIAALRNYFILQTTGGVGSTQVSPTNSSQAGLGSSLPASQNFSSSQNSLQIPQTQSSSPNSVENGEFQSGSTVDPTTKEHTLPNGGREDIAQVGDIIASQPEAYTGDDITFTVTIQNQATYKKFVRQLCFQSSEGNFGCSPGFNLDPGQVFSMSNNGRFTSSGTKSVWVTWTQDNTNFYSPINNRSTTIQIL